MAVRKLEKFARKSCYVSTQEHLFCKLWLFGSYLAAICLGNGVTLVEKGAMSGADGSTTMLNVNCDFDCDLFVIVMLLL